MHTSTVLQSGLQEAQPPGGGSGINPKKNQKKPESGTAAGCTHQSVTAQPQYSDSHSTVTVTVTAQSQHQSVSGRQVSPGRVGQGNHRVWGKWHG